jgi:hypothetical protein
MTPWSEVEELALRDFPPRGANRPTDAGADPVAVGQVMISKNG